MQNRAERRVWRGSTLPHTSHLRADFRSWRRHLDWHRRVQNRASRREVQKAAPHWTQRAWITPPTGRTWDTCDHDDARA